MEATLPKVEIKDPSVLPKARIYVTNYSSTLNLSAALAYTALPAEEAYVILSEGIVSLYNPTDSMRVAANQLRGFNPDIDYWLPVGRVIASCFLTAALVATHPEMNILRMLVFHAKEGTYQLKEISLRGIFYA